MVGKYLPIGSICTLKGHTEKIMITGFCGVKLKGDLKINDYVGCIYPEGLLYPENACSFNHSDIEKIDFIGYKNEQQLRLEEQLNKFLNNKELEETDVKHDTSLGQYKFDENGFVVSVEEQVNEKPLTEPASQYKFDENGFVVSVEEQVEEKTVTEEISQYKFDENGILISVGDDKLEEQ